MKCKHILPSFSLFQIEAFRELDDDEDDRMLKNFRPIQPLHDRIVFYNNPEEISNNLDGTQHTKPDKKNKLKNVSAITNFNVNLMLMLYALLNIL